MNTFGTTYPHEPVPYPRTMFSKPQLDRYSRQLILPGVGAAGQQRLLEAKVLVVGAGGLGSPILLYLAAAGIGTLGVVDDDVVELSNLQRQIVHGVEALGRSKVTSAAARLGDLNPEVQVEPFATRLSAENAPQLLAPYDLIVDGSDTLPTRYLLSDACVLLGKPLLYGAMSQFEGQLSLLHAPGAEGRGPCYRCVYPEPPPANIVLSCAEGGVFGALSGVIGSLMAVEVIKYIVGLGEPSHKLTHYDALTGSFRTVKLKRNPSCPSCGEHPSIRSLAEHEDYEAFCSVS